MTLTYPLTLCEHVANPDQLRVHMGQRQPGIPFYAEVGVLIPESVKSFKRLQLELRF